MAVQSRRSRLEWAARGSLPALAISVMLHGPIGPSHAMAQEAPPAKQWVVFKDKGLSGPALADAIGRLELTSNPKTVERRQLRRTDPGLFDERDLPVAPEYIAAVTGAGADVHVASKWLNAISVRATPEELAAIAALPFVERVEPVIGGRRADRGPDESPRRIDTGAMNTRGFYGYGEGQLTEVNLIGLHGLGYTGAGVVVGILDTGFRRTHAMFNQPGHPVQVIAEHDFVKNDANSAEQAGDDPDQHVHGTLILSVIGGYLPDTFVGGAYNASFILAKTEDITSETPIEEDNYVAGLEFIEANGGDVATSSLGYIDWYSQAQLNGNFAKTTLAVNVATANGLYCCTAAGNEYHDSNPTTSTLIAPADAQKVITCGAAWSDGSIADFSSSGPTADGRIKPEVLARGVNTICAWPYDDVQLAQASGTSLSTPVVASAIACLVQARPSWSVDRMRAFVTKTANDYAFSGQTDPLFIRGYGMLNAQAAFDYGCPADFNTDLFVDALDYDAFINSWLNSAPASDFNLDGFTDAIDYDMFIAAWLGTC